MARGRSHSERSKLRQCKPLNKRRFLKSLVPFSDLNRQKEDTVSKKSYLFWPINQLLGVFLLLGDSMLRRFGQIVDPPCWDAALCQGGLQTSELERRIRIDFGYSLPFTSAILMIGSNDIHTYDNADVILESLRFLFQTLAISNLERIILLSLPYSPKFAKCALYKRRWLAVNRFFRDHAPTICKKVEFLSIRDIFVTGAHVKVRTDQFFRYSGCSNPEGNFSSHVERVDYLRRVNPTVDMIHWKTDAIREVEARIRLYLAKPKSKPNET